MLTDIFLCSCQGQDSKWENIDQSSLTSLYFASFIHLLVLIDHRLMSYINIYPFIHNCKLLCTKYVFPSCRSRNFIGISFLFVPVKYFRFRNEDEKNWWINFKWFPKRNLVVLSTNWHPWNYFWPDGHKQKARNSKHQRILVFSSFRSFFYFSLIFFPVL